MFGRQRGDESETLRVEWEDGERIFRRECRQDSNGPKPALVIRIAAEHPTRANLDRLAHEYGLRDELDGTWAARPQELVQERDHTLLVLEDPGGTPLHLLLAARKLCMGGELEMFLRLAVGATVAVGAVHARGLVHKDLKPANMLVDAEAGQVWLMGFGIASRRPRERQPPEPPEVLAGTLPYMAPEQTGRMNRSIDTRSDLYSLGVTLFEMLTGTLPFSAGDPMEWVHCHVARQPTPPSERLAGVCVVPSAISAIILKLLAKTPDDRYQTAGGLERDLRHCLAQWEARARIDDFRLGEHDVPDRLVIAERLYGRERELETLVAVTERVARTGVPELVLVAGYSGIGKSSLVSELHKTLVPSRALFASGKFDQGKRDIPYSILAQALHNLIRPLLAKKEVELSGWRDALRDALGANGRLLVDLVPDLGLIVGEQSPLPELSLQDAQRRFQHVFRRVVGVFARPEHPLTLFVDDLQWADLATLELLEDLLTQPEVHHLLVIGAYRVNEVGADHPLRRKLDVLREVGAAVTQVVLTPLNRDHLTRWIADSLHEEADRVAGLACLIDEKTAGNPFFAIQFMSALVDERLLLFEHGKARWSWNPDRIVSKGYTENVADLVAGKLNRLPAKTQSALQQLACLGDRANIPTLSVVLGKSGEEVAAALWEAVRLELVERQDGSYRFMHDRVQEAAYKLIREGSRAEAHLRIGRLLAAKTPPERLGETIFEIVNQLNRGARLITSRDEREQLAEFNLIAGHRAKASTAYASALIYLNAGAALLAADSWERRRELIFALELHRAECEFLTGELAKAEERLTMLASRAATAVELATVACLRVDVYTTLDQSDRAVAACLDYLRHVDIDWSPHPTEEQGRREYQQIWSQLGSRTIEALVDLPLMSDPAYLATLDVLTKMSPPALFTDANLLCLAICRAVNLSLERGNGDGSCVAYVMLGMIAGLRFGNYEAGFRFGRLGCELVEQRRLERFQAGTYMSFANLVMPWTKHVKACRDLLRRAFDAANKRGDLTFAAFCCNNINTNLLAAGDPLAEVQHQAENGVEFAQKARFGLVTDIVTAQLEFVRTLRGLTPKFGSFNSEQFDEFRYEHHLSSNPALAPAECRYWIRKLQARFFAGDYAAALHASSKVQQLLWTSSSFFEEAEYHFYSALSQAGRCDHATAAERQEHLDAVAAHHRKLQVWAKNCPENFENRAALVGAEIARLKGCELDAERLYEKAIRSARANGFVHNEALACELATRFYAARGFEINSYAHLRKARQCYESWGADGKVRQLDQLHPHLREDDRAPGTAGTIEAPIEHLDLATVIGVSQALSGEIVLEKLIDRLMRAAIEHAGAERGLLICPQDEELRVDAEATARGEDVTVQVRERGARIPVALPDSLIRYTLRTRDTVILGDASSQNPFSADPYIVQSGARSILCLPLINQAKFIGILYLENNLTPHVFTPDRVTLLKMLASQAAISLENTRLYRDLEDREGKIRRLVDANIIGMLVADFEGRVVEANDAFLRIVGYDREDLVSGRVSRTGLTPPEWRERDIRTVAELNSTGTVQPFEKEYFRKDGSRVPVLIGGARFREGGNEADVAFVLDLTERKRAEEALQLQATLDSIPTMAWRARADGFTEYINKRWLDFTGVSLGQALGWQWLALIHPDDVSRLRDSWLQLIASENPGEAEARMRGSDGAYRWFLIRAEPSRGDAGAVVAWYGTHTDIQDLKIAESALRRSEAELADVRRVQQTLDSIPVAAWRARADGFTEYVNKRWLDYTGFSLDQALGWEWFASIHPEDVPRLRDIWVQVLASEKPGEFEVRMRRYDGLYRWFLIRAEPSRDDAGAVVAWYGTSTDIEDRTQAQARLQEMQSDFAHMNRVSIMGELTASLAHEILHPIATARNNARAATRFVDMNPPDLGEAREALACVVRDADRAKDIVGRMRDHIKKAPPQKIVFSLNEAINEVVVMVRGAIAKNKIAVSTHLMDGLVPIRGDRVQMQQVVVNLILNAVEAMSSVEDGARELSIRTEQSQTGAILFAVHDSGPGIDPKNFERVFEAFYTTKTSGIGMGLSICRSIINAHGGRLWAESNEPRGAVFQFILPVGQEGS